MSIKVVLTKAEVQKLVDHTAAILDGTVKASTNLKLADESTNFLPGDKVDYCISVTVEDGEACFKIPVINSDRCVKVPSWVPEGTVAEACVSVQILPPQACLIVNALGTQVFNKCFGL